ncbi:MAG TPA: cytochrome c oxidase subunit 3 family protein [Anaeromyxobacteraceae bacterium]|nr:cytochrome c oxidase subunit 3 family protein [Anaeromyxobacteraceae bacterium]
MSAEAALSHPAPHRDDVASRMGMWIFLLTELFLFGGIFVAYAAYRALHREAFHHAGAELDAVLGVANTAVLLTSSLTVALGVHAFRRGRDREAPCWLGLTVLLAFAFLVVKGIEWVTKYQHGLFPGQPRLGGLPAGERLFFGLYFAATGLHALHVVAGAVLLGVTCALVARGRVRPDAPSVLENAGIYWHLVDTIWIVILPLFYLAA